MDSVSLTKNIHHALICTRGIGTQQNRHSRIARNLPAMDRASGNGFFGHSLKKEARLIAIVDVFWAKVFERHLDRLNLGPAESQIDRSAFTMAGVALECSLSLEVSKPTTRKGNRLRLMLRTKVILYEDPYHHSGSSQTRIRHIDAYQRIRISDML